MREDRESGSTLAEVIVVMVLAVMLIGAAGSFLAAGFSVSARIRGTAHSILISDLILDRITETLESANILDSEEPAAFRSAGASLKVQYIDSYGQTFSLFADDDGDPRIGMGSGYLYTCCEAGRGVAVPVLEDMVYENFSIEKLSFTKSVSEQSKVISVSLELVDHSSGKRYSQTRYIRSRDVEEMPDYATPGDADEDFLIDDVSSE